MDLTPMVAALPADSFSTNAVNARIFPGAGGPVSPIVPGADNAAVLNGSA